MIDMKQNKLRSRKAYHTKRCVYGRTRQDTEARLQHRDGHAGNRNIQHEHKHVMNNWLGLKKLEEKLPTNKAIRIKGQIRILTIVSSQCGAARIEGARFCGECGTKVTSQQKQPYSSNATVPVVKGTPIMPNQSITAYNPNYRPVEYKY